MRAIPPGQVPQYLQERPFFLLSWKHYEVSLGGDNGEIKEGESARESGKWKGSSAQPPESFMPQFKGVCPGLTPTLLKDWLKPLRS